MSLKSRYRLMRMRSRLSGGRLHRRVLMLLLLVAGVFVMIAGLFMVFILVCAAAVFLAALYIWSFFSRGVVRRLHTKQADSAESGVTLEGEYTVDGKDPETPKRKR